MKTLWIEDEDALNVGRVIVTKTGTKDCVVCYSCDERDDYETRLKADMVTMLTELQLEIEGIDSRAGYDGNGMPTFANDYVRIIKVNEIIQQKINKLKENEDDTSSIMPDWHIKKIDDERWSVYTKNYVYCGTFNTKSDAYNYIISNHIHKRGIIHVHEIDGAVIEELKFPFRKF